MHRILRLGVIVLVGIAVPLQGFASAALGGCASGASMAHVEPLDHHVDPTTALAADDADADHCPPSDDPDRKCSACGACLAGIALPAAILRPPSMDATAAALPQPSFRIAAVERDDPERPPRPRLA